MKNRLFYILTTLLLTGIANYAATSATVSFDYLKTAGIVNQAKLLNAARGYQGPIYNLTWHNSFYGNMVTVGIRELRLDWIPSDSTYQVVGRDANNNLTYDFTKLDGILLPLLKRGMRPVMCMHMENIAALGITNGFPPNLNDYEAAIKAFAQHYKDLGYTGLIWESHNEPEYFTSMTPEQTYIMYDIFAHAVKSVDPTAVVGGFGSGPDKFTYIGAFLDSYKNDATKPPMDFFSYHQYGSETFDSFSQVENLFISRGLKVPPFYLTEWNDYPFVQPENDQPAHATYVAKKFYWALMHAARLAKIYFFNYADGDPSRVFTGANGLLTAGNHKKAAANTFNLYNNLYRIQLSPTISGQDTSTYDVYAIATKDPSTGAVSLILWNNRSTEVNISLQLSNLPYLSRSQEFVLTKYIIDESHGNYYYDYLYHGASPTDTAVGQSENVGVAEINTYPPASSLSRTEYLPAWSVTQIKLDPVSIFDPNTDYVFINCSSGLVMQISSSTQKTEQGTYEGAAKQKWKILDVGSGYYKIVNQSNGLALEVPGGSLNNGTQLALADWTGGTHQQWQIQNAGSYYKILNRNSGLGGNVAGSSQTEGAWIIQWTSGAGLNELWKIQPAALAPNQTFLGYWKLDESAGDTAADSSGSRRHGIVQNTNFTASSVSGKDGRALNLDGVDDHILVPAPEFHSNTLTITAWVKLDPAAVPWSGIVFNRTLNANGLNIGNGTELRYHWNNSMYTWVSGLSLPVNVWTFVALVIEPDQGTIYVDSGSGLQSATHVASHYPESFGSHFFIGCDPAVSTRHFRGAIDDVRIYNASLSSAQVAAVRDSVDHDPPTPNPMTWAVLPHESGPGAVTMTASTAQDPAGVEYYFECVSGGGHDSGWQSSPVYTDVNLSALTAEYTVKARDKSPHQNETASSNPPAAVAISRYPYRAQKRTIPGKIQAEEFDISGEGLSYHDTTAGNFGGAFRPSEDVDIISFSENSTTYYAVDAIETGEWLEYTVDSVAGQAEVSARVASTAAGGQIKVWLDTVLLATLAIPNTGSLTNWRIASQSGLTLPERTDAVIRLEFVGTGFRVDWVAFQKQEPYGAGPSPIPGTIEFENYDMGGQDVAYFDTTPDNNLYGYYRSDGVDILFSSGQYAVYAVENEWLEYTCDIEPGFYTIIVNSGTTANSPVLTLSDDLQELAVMELPKTGGWYTWQNTQFSDIYLPGGPNKQLRFTMSNSSSVLNRVEFVRQYNMADLTHNGKVDLEDFMVLSAQWINAPGFPSADIAPDGGDGLVHLQDLMRLAENWLVEQ